MNIDLNEMLNTLVENAGAYALRIFAALAILLIGRWLAGLLTRGLRALMERREVDIALRSFVTSLLYWLLIAFIIVAAMSKLGIETTSFVAMLGAAGLAVGLAIQGSLSNFAAGVLIIMFRPFRIGDYIEAGGTSGSVKDINILTTVMATPDNKRIIVPNSAIMAGTITNYSAHETRRLDLVFGVSYEDDIRKVQRVLEEIVAADARCLKEPAPTIAVLAHADSSINFAVRPWVKTTDYWSVYFDMHKVVKLRFDEEGISIPFPQRDVHLFPAPAVAATAAARPAKPGNFAPRRAARRGGSAEFCGPGRPQAKTAAAVPRRRRSLRHAARAGSAHCIPASVSISSMSAWPPIVDSWHMKSLPSSANTAAVVSNRARGSSAGG